MRTSAAGGRAPGHASDPAELSRPTSAAGDSLTVAAWTMVSRVTGLIRVAVVGAVLGPTYLGNTYQFTNSLPNLIYYGFLAGGLFSSLTRPGPRAPYRRRRPASLGTSGWRLPRRDARRHAGSDAACDHRGTLRAETRGLRRVTRGRRRGGARRAPVDHDVRPADVFFYGVVGTSTAVMNSCRRFALAAGAPAVENLGTIAVLLSADAIYGTGKGIGNLPTGEIVLLGLGSTGAVALHAATQWWGARRAGVVLMPRPGWRDSEVRAVTHRSLPALGQTGLAALQLLTLLIAANRLPGGIVAFQIGWNFYTLANNLGTAPVALSLVPRLSRLHVNGDTAAFRDTLVRGLRLGFFITIPAAAGFLVLAGPLARASSFGQMDSTAGVTMVAAALAPLSVAVIGQTAFMISTYASYARKDTRSPLRSMILEVALCIGVVSLSLLVRGPADARHPGARRVGTDGGGGVSPDGPDLADPRPRHRAAHAVAGQVRGGCRHHGRPGLAHGTVVPDLLGRPFGPRVGVIVAALVGAAVYVAVEALLRTSEVNWLIGGPNRDAGQNRAEASEPGQVRIGLPGRGRPTPDRFPRTRGGSSRCDLRRAAG